MIFVVDTNIIWKRYLYPIFSSKNILGIKIYIFLSSNKPWIPALTFWWNNSLMIRIKCFIWIKLIYCSGRMVGHISSAIGSKIVQQILFPHADTNVPFLVKHDIHSGSWSCLPRSICHDGSVPIHKMQLDAGT